MEYALVFGLAIPVMLPMLVIVLAVQCAVLHFAKEHFLLRVIHNHRPPLNYLWFSAVLGYALLAWFFVDNDLHGTRLAVFGPPTLVLYMALYDQVKSSARAAQPIAAEYGTPAYVYSAERIADNYRRLAGAFERAGSPVEMHYAVKANSNLAILRLLRACGGQCAPDGHG